jgi:hypothetical protein
MVKCGDDAGGAGLTGMGQRYGIVGAKPAPGLFHGVASCSRITVIKALPPRRFLDANAYTTQNRRASKLSYNITKVIY